MENKKERKIKTSICLPVKLLAIYKEYYRAVYRNSEQMFASAMVAYPRRDKARAYNRSKDEFEVVQVYWPVEVYNKLHAVAAALRVSVSYLVYSMLMEMSSKPTEKPKGNFSNYVMIVRSWKKNTLHIEEIIHLEDDPPNESPPLAA
jgi:type I site-specific restriction-modification system R (restriction) subunit